MPRAIGSACVRGKRMNVGEECARVKRSQLSTNAAAQ
jgi:hypothetical protein